LIQEKANWMASQVVPNQGPHWRVQAADYSRGELVADHAVHVVGVASALLAAPALLALTIQRDDLPLITGVALYLAGLVTMLASSALYNTVGLGPRRDFFRTLDQMAILLMIAGTYSPFTLAQGTDWGLGFFVFVWLVVGLAVVKKFLWPDQYERIALGLYIILGWLMLVALVPLLPTLSLTSTTLLMVGGGLYSVGILFHQWRHLPYQNAIWHAHVLAAASCHFGAILEGLVLR